MDQFELPAQVYRDLLAITPTPIVVHDADGNVVATNQAFADLLGYTLDEARRLHAGRVIHPADQPQRDADAERLIDGAYQGLATERRLVRRDGQIISARVRKAAATVDGKPIVLVIIDDATDEQAVIAELRYAVNTDDLTHLFNRRGVWNHLDALEAADFPQVLAVVDVDRLKATNDVAGHAAGDMLLQTVASRLDGAIGPGAIAARLSGDEFLVLAPAAQWPENSLATTIRKRVGGAGVTVPGGSRIVPSVSVGTALLHRAEDYSLALNAADKAMYAAKEGRPARPVARTGRSA